MAVNALLQKFLRNQSYGLRKDREKELKQQQGGAAGAAYGDQIAKRTTTAAAKISDAERRQAKAQQAAKEAKTDVYQQQKKEAALQSRADEYDQRWKDAKGVRSFEGQQDVKDFDYGEAQEKFHNLARMSAGASGSFGNMASGMLGATGGVQEATSERIAEFNQENAAKEQELEGLLEEQQKAILEGTTPSAEGQARIDQLKQELQEAQLGDEGSLTSEDTFENALLGNVQEEAGDPEALDAWNQNAFRDANNLMQDVGKQLGMAQDKLGNLTERLTNLTKQAQKASEHTAQTKAEHQQAAEAGARVRELATKANAFQSRANEAQARYEQLKRDFDLQRAERADYAGMGDLYRRNAGNIYDDRLMKLQQEMAKQKSAMDFNTKAWKDAKESLAIHTERFEKYL